MVPLYAEGCEAVGGAELGNFVRGAQASPERAGLQSQVLCSDLPGTSLQVHGVCTIY